VQLESDTSKPLRINGLGGEKMKRYFGISLGCMYILLLVAGMAMAKPSDQRQELAPDQTFVDVVGDVTGNAPVVGKAAADTTWIAAWSFEGCDETGWVRSDNRILNDGNRRPRNASRNNAAAAAWPS
jgi:hypothetical protein